MAVVNPILSTQPPLRWYGAAAVLLLHILVLLLLLQSDRFRLKPIDHPGMQIIRLFETRSESPPPEALRTPPRTVPAPITLPAPLFAVPHDGPMRAGTPFSVPLPPQGLDLGIHRDGRKSMEELFPSPAERQKKMMREMREEEELARDKDAPTIADDCVMVVPHANDPTPTPGAFKWGAVPIEVCSQHKTLKNLQKRNDLYSPR